MNFTHPTAMKPSSPDFKVREPSTRLADTKRGHLFPLSSPNEERAGVRSQYHQTRIILFSSGGTNRYATTFFITINLDSCFKIQANRGKSR